MVQLIKNYQSDLEKVARDNDINYLALYGSYARGEETPDSDVDLLVSFAQNKPKSLLDLARVQLQIKEVLNREVDLVTENSINRYIKPYIQDDIQVIYEEKS